MIDCDVPLPSLDDLPQRFSARYDTHEARVLGDAWDATARVVRLAGVEDISHEPEAKLFLDTKPLGVPVVGVCRVAGRYWIVAKDDGDRIIFPRAHLHW